MSIIEECCSKIRSYLVSSRNRRLFDLKGPIYSQFCSCLDTIEDTELAINAFLTRNKEEIVGIKYLSIYGCLQAQVVQQDAVQHLSNSIGIKFNPNEKDSVCQTIRTYRNHSIGHPTGADWGKTFVRIARHSMRHHSFKMSKKYSSDRPYEIVEVDVKDLINSQNKELTLVLRSVITELNEEVRSHHMKHRETKMTEIFKSTQYLVENLIMFTLGNETKEMAVTAFKIIESAIQKFKTELIKRDDLEVIKNYEVELQHAEHSLQKLKYFLNSSVQEAFAETNEELIDTKTAYIFANFLQDCLHKFEELAVEMDNIYSTNP